MREYWILTKLQLSSLYGVNKIRHARDEGEKKKARRSLWGLVAMVFGLGYASSIYSVLLGTAFAAAGELPSLIGLMAAASGALVLVFSVFETKGVLFGFGDYDTVMSWPVRVTSVVSARVTTMMAYNFVYTLLLLLPAGIVYAVTAHPPMWFYPVFLLGMLVTPALPTVLGAVLGTLITALTAHMKKKNLLASVVQILMACGIMAVSFTISSGMENIEAKAMSMGQGFVRMWPPAEWFMRAVQGDVLWLLLGVALSAAVLTVFVWLLSLRFSAINGRLAAVPHTGASGHVRHRAAGTVRALYRMEWKRYTGSTLYLANTAFGYVMLLALAVVLGVVRPPVLQEIFFDPSYPAMRRMIPLAVAMIVGISGTTFASISIEGKRLWIIKSLPVSAHDWLLSKALVSLTLAVPAILISGVLIGAGLCRSALEWVWMFLTPLSYAMLAAAFGLFVNIRLPRLDWTVEAEIVKQSVAALICVFSAMFASGIPIAVLLTTNAAWVTPAATLLALLLTAALYLSLRRSGEGRLYRL